MRAAHRVMRVELERDRLVRRHSRDVDQHVAALEELKDPEAPLEDPDLEPIAVPAEPHQETTEPARVLPPERALEPLAAKREVDAGVEVPSDEEDAMLRLQHRPLHQREVILDVDNDARPFDVRVAPHAGLDRLVVEAARRLAVLALRQSPPSRAYSLASSFFSGVTSASFFSSAFRRSKTERMCFSSSSVR